MSKEALSGVAIKIDRAKKHVVDLESEISTFLDRKPYVLVMEQEPETGDLVCRIRIRQPLPEIWAGIVGDVVHNLRSALDFLAVALVVEHARRSNTTASKTAISETYFPIGSSKQTFNTDKVRRASPIAIRLMERLRPYNGGRGEFWRLHQMDILDKHRLLIPVGVAHTHVGIQIRMDLPWKNERVVLPPLFMRPADRQFPITDGTVVFRVNAGVDLEIQDGDIQCVFDIAFGDENFADGEPIVSALKQMVGFVERIVGIFERRCFS